MVCIKNKDYFLPSIIQWRSFNTHWTFLLNNTNIIHTKKKKMAVIRTIHSNVLWGTHNGSSIASLWKPLLKTWKLFPLLSRWTFVMETYYRLNGIGLFIISFSFEYCHRLWTHCKERMIWPRRLETRWCIYFRIRDKHIIFNTASEAVKL